MPEESVAVAVTVNGCSITSNLINVIIKDCPIGGGGGCDVISDFVRELRFHYRTSYALLIKLFGTSYSPRSLQDAG